MSGSVRAEQQDQIGVADRVIRRQLVTVELNDLAAELLEAFDDVAAVGVDDIGNDMDPHDSIVPVPCT